MAFSYNNNPAPRESGPVGQLPQCDHWYRNLRRPCVRTTAGLNSRIPAAGAALALLSALAALACASGTDTIAIPCDELLALMFVF